jgi:outer membrane protein
MNKTALFGTLLMASSILATPVMAGESLEGKSWDAKERFMIRARIIDVVPDESSSTTIGGEIDGDFGIAPEVDFTYFFTDNIAAELIAATSKHDIKAKGTSLGDVDLGSVWALPPTLTAQYHFNPHGEVRPYVGAGIGYLFWHSEESGAVNDVNYDSNLIYALQAGMDIPVDEHWAVNFDVKKLFHNVDASVNNGAIKADVDLDPWVFGIGLGYRF